jgi:hypothetical protein
MLIQSDLNLLASARNLLPNNVIYFTGTRSKDFDISFFFWRRGHHSSHNRKMTAGPTGEAYRSRQVFMKLTEVDPASLHSKGSTGNRARPQHHFLVLSQPLFLEFQEFWFYGSVRILVNGPYFLVLGTQVINYQRSLQMKPPKQKPNHRTTPNVARQLSATAPLQPGAPHLLAIRNPTVAGQQKPGTTAPPNSSLPPHREFAEPWGRASHLGPLGDGTELDEPHF